MVKGFLIMFSLNTMFYFYCIYYIEIVVCCVDISAATPYICYARLIILIKVSIILFAAVACTFYVMFINLFYNQILVLKIKWLLLQYADTCIRVFMYVYGHILYICYFYFTIRIMCING